jgi:hypothetical protein
MSIASTIHIHLAAEILLIFSVQLTFLFQIRLAQFQFSSHQPQAEDHRTASGTKLCEAEGSADSRRSNSGSQEAIASKRQTHSARQRSGPFSDDLLRIRSPSASPAMMRFNLAISAPSIFSHLSSAILRSPNFRFPAKQVDSDAPVWQQTSTAVAPKSASCHGYATHSCENLDLSTGSSCAPSGLPESSCTFGFERYGFRGETPTHTQ